MPVIKKSVNYKKILIAFAVSLGISAVCVLAAALVSYLTDDPASYVRTAAVAALIASSFASGIAAVRINEGLIASAPIVGIMLTLFLALMSVSFFKRESSASTSLFMHAAIPLISLAGGFLARKRKSRPVSVKKKLKRRR